MADKDDFVEQKAPAVKTSSKSEPEKGPKPLTESQLKKLKKEYDASLEYQKMDDKLEKWHEHKEYLNCRWDEDDEDAVNINTLWSNAQAELPDLYFQNPKVQLTPESASFKADLNGKKIEVDNFQACKLFELKVNNVVKNMRTEPIWERIILNAIQPFGHGVGKVGYALTTESDWTNEYDIKTAYWFRWLDPRNITYDLIADEFGMVSITFEKICRLRSDLLGNANYDKSKIDEMRKMSVTDASLPEALKHRLAKAGKGYNPDLVCFNEVHDMKSRCIRWIDFEGTPKEIRKPIRRNRWFEGSDYIFLSLNVPTDDNVYPLSDAEPVVQQAKSRNKTRQAIEDHVRNHGTTIIVPDDIDDTQIEKYKIVRDRLILRLPKEHIGTIQFQSPPPISGDWYRLDEIDRRDNSETLGLPDYMMQGPKKPATHDVLVDNRLSKRVNRRRRKIKLAVIEFYRKVAGLVQEYDRGDTNLNVSEYVEDNDFMEFLKGVGKVKGKVFDPKKPFISVSKEWWQGEYGFDYEIEEQLDRPKAVQVQQLNTTVSTITANPFLNRALFDDPKVPKKINDMLFSLQGFKISELKGRDSKTEIPAEIENEMLEMGDPSRGPEAMRLKIPLPHEKNNDSEHIVTHYRRMKEMQDALTKLMGKQPQMPIDAATIEYLQWAIGELQKHLMLHDLQAKQKEEKDMMAFGGSPGQLPMNPQVDQPQAPNQGAMMGGGNTLV